MEDIKKFSKKAEEHLEAMKAESLRMIQATKDPSVKKAWYYSHLGSLDFAKEMGLISEERRQELYREFRELSNVIRNDELKQRFDQNEK